MPGCFSASRFTDFHRALVREWLPSGRAVLARLSLAGRGVAVLYGFVTGSKFDFYQGGVNTTDSGPLGSPGNLAHLLLMRALSERGVLKYDFLRGDSSYKDRLSTDQNKLVRLQVWRPTVRAAISRAAQSARRTVGKVLRRLGARLG
jgi:CelD/BcsL family acetyltransferase involved in cellulose biosynthesis